MIIKKKTPPSLSGWMGLVKQQTDLNLEKTRAYKAWMEIPVREWSDYVAARDIFRSAAARAEGFSMAMRMLAQQQAEPAIDERETLHDLQIPPKLPGRNRHG